MSHISRRRVLQAGSAGIGAGALGSLPVSAAASGRGMGIHGPFRAPLFVTDSTRVRMSGDGLGLTVAEQAGLLARLADEGRIAGDFYSNGGVVGELEQDFATLLGKERAVFMPTGTLANQLAVRTLAGDGGGRAVVQAESHLYNDTGDSVQTLSAIPLIPLAPGRATFTLEELEEAVERTRSGRVSRPVSVISIETPVRRREGETFDPSELDRILAFARQEGIRLHLDGARLLLESACREVPVADLVRPFDTVHVSLYKYLGAPSGAILAGPRSLLDGMFHERRMFGSGLPAAWPFAALPLHFLPGFVGRFRKAVEVSGTFLAEVTGSGGFAVQRVNRGTNRFRLRPEATDPRAFRERLGARGVELGAPREDGSFPLAVNETWNRMAPEDLAARFRAALG